MAATRDSRARRMTLGNRVLWSLVYSVGESEKTRNSCRQLSAPRWWATGCARRCERSSSGLRAAMVHCEAVFVREGRGRRPSGRPDLVQRSPDTARGCAARFPDGRAENCIEGDANFQEARAACGDCAASGRCLSLRFGREFAGLLFAWAEVNRDVM